MRDNHGMTISYLPYFPDQNHLLPVSAADWLPEGHLAYFIADTVDSLDLSAFHARYAKGGPRNQPFHPAMMVKVLLYGYASGVFSSRKLAKRLHEDVALRVLAAGNFPAHRTLSDFRALPERFLADAGYRSEAALAALAHSSCAVIVALGREGREITRINAEKYPHTAKMADRLKSEEGKAAYRRRKAMVEAPNGWIKSVLGFRQFSLRGIHKVRAEWKLVCLALNLRRMAAWA